MQMWIFVLVLKPEHEALFLYQTALDFFKVFHYLTDNACLGGSAMLLYIHLILCQESWNHGIWRRILKWFCGELSMDIVQLDALAIKLSERKKAKIHMIQTYLLKPLEKILQCEFKSSQEDTKLSVMSVLPLLVSVWRQCWHWSSHPC